RRARRAHREYGSSRAEPAREPVGRAVIERAGRLAHPARRRDGTLELLDAAQRGAYDDGDALGSGGGGRAGKETLRRAQEDLRAATPRAAPLRPRLELLDPSAPPDPQVVHREPLDHAKAGAPGDEPRPEPVEVSAEWGHSSGG